jgi:drug/metabolite transporter (DMT)-like permease
MTAPRPPDSEPAPAMLVVLGFAVIYIVWGSTYLAIRWSVETLPPFLMGGARFLLAGCLLHLWLRLRGAPVPTWPQVRDAAASGILLLLLGNGLVNWAEQHVTSGVTALLVGTTPIWFLVLNAVIPPRERPDRLTLVGVALGTIGVALLGRHGGDGGGAVHVGGLLAILVASASWAAGSLLSRKVRSGADPFMASSLQMLAGGAAQLVLAAALGEWSAFDPAAVTPRSLLSWTYLVFIGSLVAFSTYVWLLRASTPARVSTYAYVNPVIAVLLGWLLAGETLTARTLVAAGVILAAVVVITRRRP